MVRPEPTYDSETLDAAFTILSRLYLSRRIEAGRTVYDPISREGAAESLSLRNVLPAIDDALLFLAECSFIDPVGSSLELFSHFSRTFVPSSSWSLTDSGKMFIVHIMDTDRNIKKWIDDGQVSNVVDLKISEKSLKKLSGSRRSPQFDLCEPKDYREFFERFLARVYEYQSRPGLHAVDIDGFILHSRIVGPASWEQVLAADLAASCYGEVMNDEESVVFIPNGLGMKKGAEYSEKYSRSIIKKISTETNWNMWGVIVALFAAILSLIISLLS